MPQALDTPVLRESAQSTLVVTLAAESAPNRPPQPVREWAFLLGGITLSAVLAIALLVALFLARRRQRMIHLQKDWKVRRSAESDAWSEAGRRAEAPSAEQLEKHAALDEPPAESGPRA